MIASTEPLQNQICNLVARSCLALDNEDTDSFLALCSGDFYYRIEVQSPELRARQLWLEHDHAGFGELLSSLPEHLRRSGRLLRHLGASIVDIEDRDVFRVSTSVNVMHTALNGRTQLWASARYLDVVVALQEGLRLSRRTVDLHTRDLGIGSHVPI